MSAASDTVAVEAAGGAERYVEALAVLPGAEHVAVVDVAGERVLGEWGGPPGSARAVLDRARRAADPSRQGRRELEDTVSTTASAFHLSRLVLAGPGHPESVWVAVRINRSQGNLTWARGVLAGLGGPAGGHVAGPATSAGEEQRIPHAEDATPAPHAAAVVPPPPPPPAPAIPSQSSAPVAAPPAPEVPGAAEAQVARTATAVPLTLKPTAAETAATVEIVAAQLTVPAARTSSENRSEPPPSVPDQRSSFAPVITVPPPPSPVPDDGTTEEPAPMPAPIITAPPLPSDGPGVEGESAAGSGPDGSRVPGHPDQGRSGLPRRTPGVHLVPRPPSPTAVPPPRPATPVAGATGFIDEPSALRRLINGLRRPS